MIYPVWSIQTFKVNRMTNLSLLQLVGSQITTAGLINLLYTSEMDSVYD